MKKQTLVFCTAILLTFSTAQFVFAESVTSNPENNTLTQSVGEPSPLEMAINDLESIEELLDNGDKKTAIIITKSAKGQLRKIAELKKQMVKGMSARLDKAIAFIKKSDFTNALDQIEHVLDELDAIDPRNF